MCGISGFYERYSVQPRADVAAAMTARIRHRGPDASGVWVDEAAGVALGHQRLSILDLSHAGAQPMVSADGAFVIVFNGEVYNHADLRTLLDAEKTIAWRGHSDTETVLECFAVWGIERTLRACEGMFALALWDRSSGSLTLARDRFGEKPLYFGWQRETFLFGSELKALKAHPAFENEVSRDSLCLLLRHNCIPAPYSIYRGVYKLRPGHYLTLTHIALEELLSPEPVPYWQFSELLGQGQIEPFIGSDAQATDALETVLGASVLRQMAADVPLGAFLSGGVDSSTVVALMQALGARPVKTFTIGSSSSQYDESLHAKAVAQHLGTDHTELILRPEDGLNIIPALPSMYCEPFSDSSQIPTFLVSELASKHVKVVLTGDGGDEVFGGYNRYLAARTVWSSIARLPSPLRRVTAAGLSTVPPAAWDSLSEKFSNLLPKRLHMTTLGDKAQKLAGVLNTASEANYYRQLTSHWDDPARVVLGGAEPATIMTDRRQWPQKSDFVEWMMAMDTLTYLPDDILVKVDRASMAVSLESRAPMLDPSVIELAWRMPIDKKVRGGEGKWLLRQVLYRHVPKRLIERPKMGFGLPLDSWLRGPLRDWAELLLNEERLRREGYFRPEVVRGIWSDHLGGKRNHQHQLWTILMFQAWLEEQEETSQSRNLFPEKSGPLPMRGHEEGG
ncbi:asparagine synthase (glutamine-hydrolyzing) [Arthrobacter sp. SAFR-044]|uniref:asparagine synthase (glutamine-hydrolyzing) n=1 Tax=Arthrobacter sp. SAFR-044 TaxID=3387278 RepID=UPI003F7C7425